MHPDTSGQNVFQTRTPAHRLVEWRRWSSHWANTTWLAHTAAAAAAAGRSGDAARGTRSRSSAPEAFVGCDGAALATS